MKKQWFFLFYLLVWPASAFALDFSLKLEPAVAVPLSAPQSDLYKVGGGGSFKALVGLSRYLDIAAIVGAVGLPSVAAGADPGALWMAGGGLRLKRPHDAEGAYGLSPWLEVDALYMRTGPLDRIGYDIGAGLSIPLGELRPVWIGPFVRYVQTSQPNRANYDDRDAKLLLIGLSLELDGMLGRAPPPPVVVEQRPCPVPEACPPTPACPACPPPAELVCPPQPERLADRDGDGVPDVQDCCPDVPGLAVLQGCPDYGKVVVKEHKIELKEKVFFAWDKSKIRPRSFHLLNDVVKAMQDNRAFQVQVDGHTDSTGPDAHNQTLSSGRADAVKRYLVAHGVAAERLESKGFASSVPIETNATVAGREQNRRVEFLILNRESAK